MNAPAPHPVTHQHTDKPVLLWPRSAEDIREVAAQLGHYGYRSQLFDDLTPLLQSVAQSQPTSILIDCCSSHSLPEEEKAALRQIAQQLPIAAISGQHEIEARLEAVRMGCHAYHTRPIDMTSLLETLDRLTQPAEAVAGQVLIIDDSRALSALYAAHLQSAGFATQVVTDPLKALEALADTVPDLILLDMHMPGANGEEIAKVIRQQDAFLSIPIVFLSAENDLSRQREAMSLGGDEFLQKPIDPAHLISAVQTRVTRYRALRALMVRDSLTGLLNHVSFKERLTAEVARAQRQGKPLSVGLIDIDHFKRVNDTWGHPAGDRVIKSLSRLLKQRLRGADVIGRYGGEEFAVALTDTGIDGARIALDHIRESFANIVQQVGEQTFQCTFSAGLASYAEGLNGEALIAAADACLYAAKHGGRNQISISTG